MVTQRSRHRQDHQAGVTVIELMISMVIASLVAYFVLDINTGITNGYRGQMQTANMNATLRSGERLLVRDALGAGYAMPNARLALAPGTTVIAVEVVNDSFGIALNSPDLVRFYRGDSRSATVVSVGFPDIEILPDLTGAVPFSANELVILGTDSNACLLLINDVAGNVLAFHTGVYNAGNGAHCASVVNDINGGKSAQVTGFSARSYRIDPADATQTTGGVLQLSTTGPLEPDTWTDLGYGFSNLQVAVRYLQLNDPTDPADDVSEWRSSDNMETPLATAEPVQMTISIEQRSIIEISGTGATATPAFVVIDGAAGIDETNNNIGDWDLSDGGCEHPTIDPCSIDFSNPPQDMPTRYDSNYIYRWTTTSVDVRNTGVAI